VASKVRKLIIGVALAVLLLLGTLQLVLSYSKVGIVCEIGTGGLPLLVSDRSAVPQPVVEDATRLATELYGEGQEKCNDFVSQLLTTYEAAKDKDFIVIFNPGGWGGNLVENSPGWQSISTGIKSELDSSGYTSLWLNYRRTVEGSRGRLDEAVEMMTRYPSKAEDLASRIEFITIHVPELRVILAGESTGTVICDRVMIILGDNPQVYSIQTGPPFWYDSVMSNRTLVMTSNGIVPDSVNQGDFPSIIRGYFKIRFNLAEPEDDFGTTPHYIAAPGHDYWWQYPEVYSQIISFLEQNFGIKWQ